MTAEPLHEIETLDKIFRQEGLSQAVRADLVRRRRDAYERLHPEAVQHGGVRRGWKLRRQAPSFVTDTAAALGISHRTVRRLLRLAENLE